VVDLSQDVDIQVLDAVPVLIVAVDCQGLIVRFNRACTRLTGYEPAQVVGQPFVKLVAQDRAEACQDWLARGQRNGYATPLPLDLIGIAGDRRRVSWAQSVCRDGRGQVTCLVLTGTEAPSGAEELTHLQVQDELQASEERFRTCFNHAPVSMGLTTLDGRFVKVNRALCNLLGYTQEEMLGRSIRDITHPDDLDKEMELFQQLICGQLPSVVMEKRNIHKNGSIVYIQIGVTLIRDRLGKPTALIGISQDVTAKRQRELEVRALNETLEQRVAQGVQAERLRAEELARSGVELRQQKNILRLVLDSMGDGVAVVNEVGQLVLMTPAAERILGTPPEGLQPSQWPHFFGFHLPDQVTPYPAPDLPLQRAMRKESVNDAEIFVRNSHHPQGTWISTTTRPLVDEGGVLQGAVSVIHDLSGRKRAEQELHESVRIAEELAQRNSWLIQELEHRVRNNLASLIDVVSLMRGHAPSVDAFADAIDGRLQAMVNVDKLLSQSQWHEVDLFELVHSSLGAMQYLARSTPAVQVSGPKVRVPARRVLPLTLILLEWQLNSCKYGAHRSPDAALHIRWDHVDETTPHRVRLNWRESGVPPIHQPGEPSLGTELVHAFAKLELRGSCQLRFPATGADHLLEFSIEPEAKRRPASDGAGPNRRLASKTVCR
jgi:PAS domain S-box-containing protein